MRDQTMSIILSRLRSEEPKQAGEVLLDFLKHGKESSSYLAIRENPDVALVALQHGDDELGLSRRAAADALEEVLDACGTPEQAQRMLNEYLTPDRQAELLGGRGELASAVAMAASINVIHAFLLNEAEETIPEKLQDELSHEHFERTALFTAHRSAHLYTLAQKLKDHPSYREILDLRIGDASFQEHVLYGIWREATAPKNLADIPLHLFYDVGLEPEDCLAELEDVIVTSRDRFINPEELSAAAHMTAPPEIEIADEDSSAEGHRQIVHHEKGALAEEDSDSKPDKEPEPDLDLG